MNKAEGSHFSAKYIHGLLPLKLAVMVLVVLFSSGNVFSQIEVYRYELVKLEFRGNNSFSSSDLSNVVVSKETPMWLIKFLNKLSESIGRKPSYFDSLLIKDDLAALKSFYQDNGFFNASFSSSYKLNKEEKTAELYYTISEGERYVIRSFAYSGIDSLPAELKTKLSDYTIDSAKYFSKLLVEQNTTPFISYLRDNGFMLADLGKPVVNIHSDSNYVNINTHVTPGKRYIIDSISVEKKGEGQDEVKDGLIRKLVGIDQGDYYSADEKQRAQVRLYRTNLFTSVLVSAITADTAGNRVPLNVTADIGPMNELSPELIINNELNSLNVGVGANYQKRNFFGEARTFTLSGSLAIRDVFKKGVLSNLPDFLKIGDNNVLGILDLRATVEQPYLWGSRITGRLEGYWNESKEKNYKIVSYGSRLTFEFELPKFVYINSLQAYYSVERPIFDLQPDFIKNTLLRNASLANASKDSLQKLNSMTFNPITRRQVTSIIGVDMSANKTDNFMFPTNGYYITLSLEEANLLPALINRLGAGLSFVSQFYRVQSTFSWFPDLYGSKTSAFGIKLRSGYLQSYTGGNTQVPINKRFTAGGSNSVRGWRAREIVPANTSTSPIDLLSNPDYLFGEYASGVGGTFLLEGSFETRNRLFGQFGSAVFVDYGNVWEGYQQFSFKDLAVAFGFGFRYYSPFAPIRLDFGLKAYDPASKESFLKMLPKKHFFMNFFDIFTLHIGIGEAF